MRIVDLSQTENTTFEALRASDVFKYDDRIFMKVGQPGVEVNNAYDLIKMRLTAFTPDTAVCYVPSELVLHERGWDKTMTCMRKL